MCLVLLTCNVEVDSVGMYMRILYIIGPVADPGVLWVPRNFPRVLCRNHLDVGREAADEVTG